MIKAIVCQLCGSNDMVEKGHIFECQHCGTKHVLDGTIKKIKEDNPQNVKKFSREDLVIELENFIKIARSAKNDNDNNKAIESYKLFLKKLYEYRGYVGNTYHYVFMWEYEARFFSAYFEALNTPIEVIDNKAASVLSGATTFFKQLANLKIAEEQKNELAVMVAEDCIKFADFLFENARSCFENSGYISSADITIRNKDVFAARLSRSKIARDILYTIGDIFTDVKYGFNKYEELKYIGIKAWKDGINKHYLLDCCENKIIDARLYGTYSGKIRKYDKSFEPQKLRMRIGCYIATCVYGSYDCPEVWVLRRFRDGVLSKNVLGRLFINFYYAVSPRLVSRFGTSNLFRKIWQKPLNALVSFLRKKGFEDTPYND